MSEEQIHRLQNERFLARIQDAWNLPFYARRWSAAGLEPGDITSLDDLEKIPTFTSDELNSAIEAAPPFGDHHPSRPGDFADVPPTLKNRGSHTDHPPGHLLTQP